MSQSRSSVIKTELLSHKGRGAHRRPTTRGCGGRTSVWPRLKTKFFRRLLPPLAAEHSRTDVPNLRSVGTTPQ